MEQWIAAWFKTLAAPVAERTNPPALLEIRGDILREVKSRIQARGEGRFVLPYNHIEVRITASDPERFELYEAAFIEDASLEREIREMLADSECLPKGLSVDVSVVTGAPTEAPFTVRLQRHRRPGASAVRPCLELVVVAGRAGQPRYLFSGDRERINLGRMQEVVSESGGLLRQNDVAFDECESTVGRQHAYIRFDACTGCYRLCDDLSGERGTRLIRQGRIVIAPRASSRGIQIRPGDEIRLGQARLRVDVFGSAG
jgi:hypothetical protein